MDLIGMDDHKIFYMKIRLNKKLYTDAKILAEEGGGGLEENGR